MLTISSLWEAFYLLVVAKCIRYYENHGRGWHYEADPVEGQVDETIDVEAINGVAEHPPEPENESDYEEGNTSLQPPNEGSEKSLGAAQKRHSQFTPVNNINYYIQDDEPNEPAPEESRPQPTPESTVTHRSRKRGSLPTTGSPRSKRAKTSQPPEPPASTVPESIAPRRVNGMQPNGSLSAPAPGDPLTMPHPGGYPAGAFPPISSTNPVISEVLGPFMDSPVVSQLIGPNGLALALPDWERLRSVFENVPATRTDAQALVAELSKKANGAIGKSPLNTHTNGIELGIQATPTPYHNAPPALPGFASVTRRSPEPNFGETPRSGNGPSSTTPTGMPNSTSWRAASYSAVPQPPQSDQPQSLTPAPGPPPAEHGRSHEMTPTGGDTTYSDALERAELEIDWCVNDEAQGFIQLEAGDDVHRFFRKIDDEMPPRLRDRAVSAVRVKHLNPPPNTGRAFNGRIRRGAEPGFRALVRRLRQLRDGSTPEIMVTVEWEG